MTTLRDTLERSTEHRSVCLSNKIQTKEWSESEAKFCLQIFSWINLANPDTPTFPEIPILIPVNFVFTPSKENARCRLKIVKASRWHMKDSFPKRTHSIFIEFFMRVVVTSACNAFFTNSPCAVITTWGWVMQSLPYMISASKRSSLTDRGVFWFSELKTRGKQKNIFPSRNSTAKGSCPPIPFAPTFDTTGIREWQRSVGTHWLRIGSKHKAHLHEKFTIGSGFFVISWGLGGRFSSNNDRIRRLKDNGQSGGYCAIMQKNKKRAYYPLKLLTFCL